jgi:alkanesulfonate monooxygenase SsuD/methylene tetrahydromethanopterin reductase-like flavin-dependent oxidoreductase (luciferase family)
MQVFGTTIRFNVQATTRGWTYEQFRDNWLRFEALGFDVTYSVDHFVPENPAMLSQPVWEGPTIISAMAALTSRMRVGLMVAGNTYRNPGILAKIACTVDHVSNGRMELGMGSGHTETEHRMYDIPYYTRGKRLRMFAESAKIVRSLLAKETTTFDGEYYHFQEARCEPKPVQRPFPLLVGGIGEQLSMRIVAESADIWNNWTSPSPEEYAPKLDALVRHCEDVGRDPNEIRKSIHIKPVIGASDAEIEEQIRSGDGRHRSQGTPAQIAETLLQYCALGVGDFVFMFDHPGDYRTLELLANEVAPRVRAEGPALLQQSLGAASAT